MVAISVASIAFGRLPRLATAQVLPLRAWAKSQKTSARRLRARGRARSRTGPRGGRGRRPRRTVGWGVTIIASREPAGVVALLEERRNLSNDVQRCPTRGSCLRRNDEPFQSLMGSFQARDVFLQILDPGG